MCRCGTASEQQWQRSDKSFAVNNRARKNRTKRSERTERKKKNNYMKQLKSVHVDFELILLFHFYFLTFFFLLSALGRLWSEAFLQFYCISFLVSFLYESLIIIQPNASRHWISYQLRFCFSHNLIFCSSWAKLKRSELLLIALETHVSKIRDKIVISIRLNAARARESGGEREYSKHCCRVWIHVRKNSIRFGYSSADIFLVFHFQLESWA